MAQSDHFDITLTESTQNNKTTSFNDMHQRLEDAVASELAHAMPDANDTLTDEEALQNARFVLTGALTGDRDLNVPDNTASAGKYYQVRDETTGGNITFQVTGGGGVGVVLPKLQDVLIYCDSTDCVLVFRNLITLTTPILDVSATGIKFYLPAPVAGRVRRFMTNVNTALGAGNAVVEIKIGGVTVTGSPVTIAATSALGTTDDSGIIADVAANLLAELNSIEVDVTTASAAGAIACVILIEPEA